MGLNLGQMTAKAKSVIGPVAANASAPDPLHRDHSGPVSERTKALVDALHFSPPDRVDAPPGLIIVSQISGGTSKTWTSTLVIDAAIRAGRTLHIFENDRQDILQAYGSVRRIKLAATEEVVHNPTADIEVHEDLDAALRRLAEHEDETIVYDTSAASLNRLGYVVDMLNIPDRIVAMGSHCLVLVPVSARQDIASEALVTFKVWKSIMPAPHRVVPVIFYRDGDPTRVSEDHPLRSLVAMAEDGCIVQPRVPLQVLLAHKGSGLPLYQLADLRDPLATMDIAKRAGIAPVMAELLRRACADVLADIDPQMALLGFRHGA